MMMLKKKKASLSSSPPPLQTLPFRSYVLKRSIEIEYCFVCDSPRVACFLRLLLSAGAMTEMCRWMKKRVSGYIFGYRDLLQNCYDA